MEFVDKYLEETVDDIILELQIGKHIGQMRKYYSVIILGLIGRILF